jgi:hypothetical protein
MGDYQQFIEKILDDFNEEAGSTIEPHKQCATLVFNRHIDTGWVRVELKKVNLGMVVEGVNVISCWMLVGCEWRTDGAPPDHHQ